MVTHYYPNFLADEEEYQGAQEFWNHLWADTDSIARDLYAWRTPWLTTGSPAILDGNPIFSAFSPTMTKGLRIIQYAPVTHHPELSYWLDTFGGHLTDPRSVHELVIACALSDEAALAARKLMNLWIMNQPISVRFLSEATTGLSTPVVSSSRSTYYMIPAA